MKSLNIPQKRGYKRLEQKNGLKKCLFLSIFCWPGVWSRPIKCTFLLGDSLRSGNRFLLARRGGPNHKIKKKTPLFYRPYEAVGNPPVRKHH
jgi:hypothetical protein